ncbi:MBL fold metallo-hydrolase [Streptomyces sp. NPDC046716]|uniref:MBL fold metallo-hydrolase n=1 Tax=Streptomyces sp. NPDC046716 TaxID=3157093 RepID=UPI003409C169
MSVAVHPLFSPWGRFGLYSFLIDAPELAVVDTGITSSPAAMAKELTRLGRRIEDVRWILLTHGHIDHVGGAHALWELTGRQAQVVIHEADAPLLRSRRAHVEEYLTGRGRYLNDAEGEAKVTAATEAVISGEMEPTMLLKGGETLSLGGDATVSVHSVPGHTPGSVAYVLDGQNDVFVGDAVQIHGAANGFPGYADPGAYRTSIEYLRDRVRPSRLFLGHPYRLQNQEPPGVELDRKQAESMLDASLDIEAGVRAAACNCQGAGPTTSNSPYAPFASAAAQLGYDGDPALEPSPFFTTMHGYHTQDTQEKNR